MKKLALLCLLMFVISLCAFSQAQTAQRPHILGIDHVAFYTTNPDGVKKLYGGVLGLNSAYPIENLGPGAAVNGSPVWPMRYMVGMQWVGYSSAPDPKATDRMDHIAFTTDDIVAVREYLTAKGIKVPQIQERIDHSRFFVVDDPEGHRVEFVEREKPKGAVVTPPCMDHCGESVSRHMIHAGFLVYHLEAENHFYRDILGFRPYWHGGMKDDVTEWISLQVPDGSDWIEFMVNQPEPADLQLTGVMNHISLGVADIKKAQAMLESRGWKPHGDENAQLGRDGKWQLNLYDPDLMRVELMEFKPVQKPCCSEFTAEHPKE
jgi:catechol 2,3-dioxygenase-like lactoylglutathione lyase family enzyme